MQFMMKFLLVWHLCIVLCFSPLVYSQLHQEHDVSMAPSQVNLYANPNPAPDQEKFQEKFQEEFQEKLLLDFIRQHRSNRHLLSEIARSMSPASSLDFSAMSHELEEIEKAILWQLHSSVYSVQQLVSSTENTGR